MDEQKNNLENNNPENLDYSFDFTNQLEPEQKNEVEETLTVEPAVEQQPDVSVPVMENAVVEETPAQEIETTEESVTAPEQPDVSVPVMEDTVAEQTTEEIKDGKSTLKFVIILVVIIVAFIIALPFALKFLGY